MWSHYANQFKGCVFEFEVIKDVHVFMQTLPVHYSKNYPTVEFTNVTSLEDLNQPMLIKYIGWSYENERRILRLWSGESALSFKPSALSRIYLGCNFEKHKIRPLTKISGLYTRYSCKLMQNFSRLAALSWCQKTILL